MLGNIDNKTQWGVLPPLHPTASLLNPGFTPALDEEENPSPPTVHNHLKPGGPPAFDGDCTKGHTFMNSCVLYQLLCTAELHDDQAKIHWVLSYMKSNCTATFANHTTWYETKYGAPHYATWKAFHKVFIETCLENESAHALMCLKSDCYFQGK